MGLLVVSTADPAVGEDPARVRSYGWLVWGHQTVAGNLNTNAAPSWKPLPYLFTVPFGLFGHYQLWLWMVTSLAVSLAGAVFAGRIAYRLTAREPPSGARPACVAAVFAALGLLRDQHLLALHAQRPVGPDDRGAVPGARSTATLPAATAGRSCSARWPALGRPEVWLFLGLYSIWAWLRVPSMRLADRRRGSCWWSLLWFGIPALTSRTPFVAASNALGSGRRLRSDRVFGTIGRFLDLNTAVLELTALLAVAIAVVAARPGDARAGGGSRAPG